MLIVYRQNNNKLENQIEFCCLVFLKPVVLKVGKGKYEKDSSTTMKVNLEDILVVVTEKSILYFWIGF